MKKIFFNTLDIERIIFLHRLAYVAELFYIQSAERRRDIRVTKNSLTVISQTGIAYSCNVRR